MYNNNMTRSVQKPIFGIRSAEVFGLGPNLESGNKERGDTEFVRAWCMLNSTIYYLGGPRVYPGFLKNKKNGRATFWPTTDSNMTRSHRVYRDTLEERHLRDIRSARYVKYI